MKNKKAKKFLLEAKDMLAGAAFPFMLMLILGVSFIGMVPTLTGDKVLSIVLLVIGEVLFALALIIFGKQSGVTSVRKLVSHAKKLELGIKDEQSVLAIGEYSAYKGFLIGFICCVPYIIFQLLERFTNVQFFTFILRYVFPCIAIFPYNAQNVSGWYNFLMMFFPVIVHGVAYIIGAHLEWKKQQQAAELQVKKGGKQ